MVPSKAWRQHLGFLISEDCPEDSLKLLAADIVQHVSSALLAALWWDAISAYRLCAQHQMRRSHSLIGDHPFALLAP